MEGEYILFVLQESNFQTRSMLVPKEAFLKVRNTEYEILKQNSKQQTIELDSNNVVVVNNLLVQPIIFDGNIGKQCQLPFTNFYNMLLNYATNYEDNYYLDLIDVEWYDNSKLDFCKGFDHVKNYLNCKNMENINIFDSFLFLERKYKSKNVTIENKQIEKIINSYEEYKQ